MSHIICVLDNGSDEYANKNGLKFQISETIKLHCLFESPRTKMHQLSIWYGNVTGTIQLTLVIDNRSVRSASPYNQDCNKYVSTNRICPKSEYGNDNMNAIINQQNNKIRSKLASRRNASFITKLAASSYRNYSGDFLNMVWTNAACTSM